MLWWHCHQIIRTSLQTYNHATTSSLKYKYKLAMIVYKCLHGLAPIHLVDDSHAIPAIAGKRHLLSADTGTLFVPRTTTLGMRSFAVDGPHIWNSLPAALRTATPSPLAFARHLKTHLFNWDGLTAHQRTTLRHKSLLLTVFFCFFTVDLELLTCTYSLYRESLYL